MHCIQDLILGSRFQRSGTQPLHMLAIRQWLEERRYSVRFQEDGDSSVFTDKKQVIIDSCLPREEKISVMLHECGHILISESRRRRPKCVVSGASLSDMNGNRGRYKAGRKSKKIAVFHEELEAWERGLSLGHRLGIRVHKRRFEKIRAACLATYARHL